MKIEFESVIDFLEWDSLVTSLPNYSFLNSKARLEHLKGQGSNMVCEKIMVEGNLAGVLTGNIGNSKIFGKFLELKHSPLLKEEFNTEEVWKSVLEHLEEIAEMNNCFMVRVAPLVKEDPVLSRVYKDVDTKEAPVHNIDALISQYFDLSKSEEDLRHDMSSSTRNNINKLMKNPDISVKVFNDNSQFELFKKFHDLTTKLKGYTDKPISVLLDELQKQVDSGMCHMIVGYFKEEPISIWQCTIYGKYMHIYQAGSDTEFREKNVRITYLLFWEAVKLAKELGCKTLDLFGGMVPEGYVGEKHPWKGVSSFKESLGGQKVTYMHPRDIVINKGKYLLYYYYSTLRVKLKGYTTKW